MHPASSSRLRLIPILVAQGLGFACGVIGVRLNSHLIPPAALGVYGVFLTFAPIGMWVVHAGLLKFTGRHWAAAESRPAMLRTLVSAWKRRLLWLALGAAIAAATMAPLGSRPWSGIAGALAVSAAALALAAMAQAALQAERAHWPDCAVTASAAVSRTFLPPLLFAASGGVMRMLWLGFSLHALIFAGAGAWALRRYWYRVPTDGTAPAAIAPVYEGPLFLLLASAAWILSGLNRWLVAGFFGNIEAGYFTLAGGAAIIVPTMLGTVLLQYFQPGFFALGDGGAPARPALARQVERIALLFSSAALAIVGALAWVAPWLVGPLISESYRASLHWILPAGCFAVATTTGVFFHTLMLAGRRETACGPVDLTTAAVLVAGGFAAAFAGQVWFERWLLATPLVPWLLTRPLARRLLLKPE